MKGFIVSTTQLRRLTLLEIDKDSFTTTTCGEECVRVQYTTEFKIAEEKLEIYDRTIFDALYKNYEGGPESLVIEDAHINIISGFYEEVKYNHFANAPVSTLGEGAEFFYLSILPVFKFSQ